MNASYKHKHSKSLTCHDHLSFMYLHNGVEDGDSLVGRKGVYVYNSSKLCHTSNLGKHDQKLKWVINNTSILNGRA